MPQEKRGRAATADKIAALIRIYRSALASGDEVLSKSTAVSLERFGINASDLAGDASVTVCINGATDSPFVQWLKEKGFKVVNNPSGLDQKGGAS